MKPYLEFLTRATGAIVITLSLGCANLGSEPALPPTGIAMKQALIGRWYKTQTYVRGEERPPAQPEIEFRANGACTYYITASDYDPNLRGFSPRESWPGHWRLEGTKIYRTWESNWHHFAGRGPGNAEIVQLTSEEMKLRTEPFGVIEQYYRRPHWDEREPFELHPERSAPWE